MTDLFAYPHQPGARDRDTSEEAAETVAKQSTILRARALDEIERIVGLTADDVAGRMGMSILSIRPRVTELSRLGKVRDSGARRPNASGRRAIVWAAINPRRLKGNRT